jgi:hypothetical protein
VRSGFWFGLHARPSVTVTSIAATSDVAWLHFTFTHGRRTHNHFTSHWPWTRTRSPSHSLTRHDEGEGAPLGAPQRLESLSRAQLADRRRAQFRRSMKEKDTRPHHISIPAKDPLAIVPPKKVRTRVGFVGTPHPPAQSGCGHVGGAARRDKVWWAASRGESEMRLSRTLTPAQLL